MTLEPKFLGPQLRDHLRLQLYRQVEGICNGRYGYIVAIVTIDSIDNGVVQDGTGAAIFQVKYTAIVLKPYRNETVDATITAVNKMGFFASVGPLQVFVSNHVRIESESWQLIPMRVSLVNPRRLQIRAKLRAPVLHFRGAEHQNITR